jgi:hypothetical protein
VGGLQTVPVVPGKSYEYGQTIMASLPDDDPKYATQNILGPDGQPMAKYPWLATPLDYDTPGNLLLTHMYAALHDENRWRQVMEPSGRYAVDKWLSFVKAEGNSAIATGILFVYFLHRMGYITTQDVNPDPLNPTVFSPYEGSPEGKVPVRSGGIRSKMTSEEFAVRLSELFGNQTPDINGTLSPKDDIYFKSMRRLALLQIFYNGKHRGLEFGGRNTNGVPNVTINKTRDISTGEVDKSSREGRFLDIQLNHYRTKIACEMQALDSFSAKKLGTCISGPNRKKRINIALTR